MLCNAETTRWCATAPASSATAAVQRAGARKNTSCQIKNFDARARRGHFFEFHVGARRQESPRRRMEEAREARRFSGHGVLNQPHRQTFCKYFSTGGLAENPFRIKFYAPSAAKIAFSPYTEEPYKQRFSEHKSSIHEIYPYTDDMAGAWGVYEFLGMWGAYTRC
jgi:hypothetical protein